MLLTNESLSFWMFCTLVMTKYPVTLESGFVNEPDPAWSGSLFSTGVALSLALAPWYSLTYMESLI